MATRRLSGIATSSSVPDNGGDHSGGGGGGGGTGATYVDDVFSTYLYEGNGGTQDIVNGINLGGGTLLAGSWRFQSLWEVDKVIGSFRGAKAGDYIVGITVGAEDTGVAEIKANGNVVPVTSSDQDAQRYLDAVHLMRVDVDGDIDFTSATNLWAANFVLIRGASEITPKTAMTVGVFNSIQDPSYSSDGSGLFLFSDRSPYSADFGDLNEYSSEDETFHTYIGGISGDGSSVAQVNVTGLTPAYANCYATFEMKGMPDATPSQLQGGKGGMVWIKCRNSASGHNLFDTERGGGRFLCSEKASADDAPGDLTLFNSDGFSLESKNGSGNYAGNDFASWTFRKAPNFFDVVTYTGDSVAGREIPHNLGVAPGMVIVKNVTSAIKWFVWHRDAVGTGAYAYLNETDPFRAGGSGVFSDVGMTSTTFGLGTDEGTNGVSGDTYVAYLFAHDDSDESMIKCGSYTGSGNAVGPEIDLGFEPQFIMVKSSSKDSNWIMLDSMRGVVTGDLDEDLYANMTYAGAPTIDFMEFTATGFIPKSNNGDTNSNGADYIYIAIRRPNKPAEEFDPEELFAIDSKRDQTDPGWISGFPTDFALHRTVDEAGSTQAQCRLMGTQKVFTDQSAAEAPISAILWDYMDGNRRGNGTAQNTELQWMWRRAPGFMDVVSYIGSSGNTSFIGIPHNLGVEPDMAWIKKRDSTYANGDWNVYLKEFGPTKLMWLNKTDGIRNDNDNVFGSFNEDKIRMSSSDHQTNYTGSTYVAYLFASVPGISKVGSYTGNGSEVEVDCGFTAGARWLLVKRVDSTGDWYFTSNPNNFKTLSKLNAKELQVNHMSTYNDIPSGFRVTQMSNDLCVDGAEYIFYAIA